MKNVLVLTSAAMLCTVLGCSHQPQKTISQNAPAAQASAASAPANPSPAAEPETALPVPSIGQANHQAWHTENVKDQLVDGVALKVTSLDGKYDLVVVQEGSHSFLSFARHSRWESVHSQPAKGKLMVLRAKFEDGEEKRIEWDELGYGTENLCGVLWSYPGKKDAPIGPVAENAKGDSVGGDELLVQEMTKHKTMLLEVAPGVTTQFDLTGLAQETQKLRAPKTQPVLEAREGAE
jgi:hypothetical protein